MTHRILNWVLAAAVIAGWLTMASHFDQKRFEGDERHEAAAVRFARAAQEVCGPNATWRETTHKGEVVCLTKRNQPTKTAMVTK